MLVGGCAGGVRRCVGWEGRSLGLGIQCTSGNLSIVQHRGLRFGKVGSYLSVVYHRGLRQISSYLGVVNHRGL